MNIPNSTIGKFNYNANLNITIHAWYFIRAVFDFQMLVNPKTKCNCHKMFTDL